MAQSGYDRQITIFSPEGNLYQIEYAFNAVNSANVTSLAVRGDNCVVLVTQKKVQDKLLDPTSITSMYRISKRIGVMMTGLAPDAMPAVQRARQEAAQFEYENGYPMSTKQLVERMADVAQLYTQQAFMRALGIVAIYAGFDEDGKPQLFRVDPAGYYMGFKACAAGVKETEAMGHLEKALKLTPDIPVNERVAPKLTRNEAIETAISCFQETIGSDAKTGDIEVAVVDSNGFQNLSDNEIDSILNTLSDRD